MSDKGGTRSVIHNTSALIYNDIQLLQEWLIRDQTTFEPYTKLNARFNQTLKGHNTNFADINQKLGLHSGRMDKNGPKPVNNSLLQRYKQELNIKPS